MSREIDQHVVEMVFDNDKFEKDARTTMSTLDKLKEKLGFGDASDGFEKVEKTVNKMDFSHAENGLDRLSAKFSTLGVAGMAAIQNITNKVVEMGEKLVNALVFDAPKAGFQEYELQQNTIQTILSATGEKLEVVKKQLDELNEYADKTIYSFSDMTQNISKFTNQGVDLRTSVNAIKGISNLAADAGATAAQASHSMYNFAQALGTGYVQWIDWRSIMNATMDTRDFKDALVEVAERLGTVKKEMNKTTGQFDYFITKEKKVGSGKNQKTTLEKIMVTAQNFKDTLQSGWLTNDVLLKTLAIYAGEVSEETLVSMGFLKDQAKELVALGERATEAATKIKTASQMFDTWAEAAGTGWARSFELIFGDFEEAKSLFTSIGHKIGDEIDKMSDARNKFLEGWHKGDGYKNFTAALNGIVDAGLKVKDLFGRGFTQGLLGFTGSTDVLNGAIEFTKQIKMAVDSLNNSLKANGATDSLYAFMMGISQGAGGALSIVLSFFSGLGSAVNTLLTMLKPFTRSVGLIIHLTGTWIAGIARFIKTNKVFETTFSKVLLLMKPAIDILNTIAVKVAEAFSKFKKWSQENHVLEKVWYALSAALGIAALAVNKIAQIVPKAYRKVKDFLKGIWTSVKSWAKPAFDWISEKFAKLTEIGGKLIAGDFSGVEEVFAEIEKTIGEGLASVREWLDEKILKNPIVAGIIDFCTDVWDVISAPFKPKDGKKGEEGTSWWTTFKNNIQGGIDEASKWLDEKILKNPIVEKIGAFFAPIISAMTNFFAVETKSTYGGTKGGNAYYIVQQITWWDKIKTYFTEGYAQATKWFDENVQPIVTAIGDFFSPITGAISKFFGSYVDENGETQTWWDRLDTILSRIKGNAIGWFKKSVDPILEAISGFFKPITDKLGEFFADTTDENGETETWWERLKNKFQSGIDTVKAYFESLKQNPIVQAIENFFEQIRKKISSIFGKNEVQPLRVAGGVAASDVFLLKGTKEMHDSLYANKNNFWDEIIEKFQQGINNVRLFFRSFSENPVVTAIGDFFTEIIEKVKSFFITTTDEDGNKTTWWDRLKLHFISGKNVIVNWFKTKLLENPILQAIGDFFKNIIEKTKSFFVDTTNEDGSSTSWWERVKAYFNKGKMILVQWFNTNVAVTPIWEAITGFFNSIKKRVNTFFVTTTDSEGNSVTWWDKLINHFNTGVDAVKNFFGGLTENPVIKEITKFFSGMGDAFMLTLKNGFGTYEKAVGMAGDRDEVAYVTLPWYHRFIDIFEEGFAKITRWFKDLARNNPIIGSVTNFFSSTWKSIGDVFTNGGTTGFDFKSGARQLLEGAESKIGEAVDKLKSTIPQTGGAAKEVFDSVMGTITNLFSGPAPEEVIEKNTEGSSSLLGVLARVISLIFEGFMLIWQNLSDKISTMKFDALWAFLDKLMDYWKIITLGNFVAGVKNVTTMLSFRMRAELFEKLAGMFLSMASFVAAVAALGSLENGGFEKGAGFVLGLFVFTAALIAMSSKMGKNGDATKKLSDNFDTISTSLTKTLGSAGFLAAMTALVGAVSGAVTDIARLSKDGFTAEDIISAIGYLAMALGAVWIISTLLSSGGTWLTTLIKNKYGSAFAGTGLELNLGSVMSTGGDSNTIDKFLNMSVSNLNNIAGIVAIGTSLKSMTGALKDIDDLMKTHGWKTPGDAIDQIGFLAELMGILFGFMSIDRLAQVGANAADRKWGSKGTGEFDWKDSISKTLESAANILSIAEAVKILVEALETIARLTSIYDKAKVDDAVKKLQEILAVVFVDSQIAEVVNTIADKWSSNKFGTAVSDGSTTGIIAAIANNPIIAIAGAVWLLVKSLGNLIDISKKLPDGEEIQAYLDMLGSILTSVLTSDILTMVFQGGLPSKPGAGLNTMLTTGALIGGVAGILYELSELMKLADANGGFDKLDEAATRLGKTITDFLLTLTLGEALASVASKIPPQGFVILGIMAAVLFGLVWMTGNTAASIGQAFTDISEGIKDIAHTITSLPEEDITKIERFGNAIGSLATANATMSGSALPFLDQLLKQWFIGDTENLGDLGQYTEDFSKHIPEIVKNLEAAVGKKEAFENAIMLALGMAELNWMVPSEHVLSSFGTDFSGMATNIASAAESLANASQHYGVAMLGLEFIQDAAILATYFASGAFQNAIGGFREINEFATALASEPEFIERITEVGSMIADSFYDGKNVKISEIEKGIDKMVAAITNKRRDFQNAGNMLIQGFVSGILNVNNQLAVQSAGFTIGRAAVTGLQQGIDSNSPSREAYKYGGYFVEGFVNAINDDNYLAYREGTDLASEALWGMQSVLSDDLAASMEDDFLTIRPVMDMSDIQNGMDTIDAYTHRYGEYAYGAWRSDPVQPQTSFGNYSANQARTLGQNDSGVFAVYDDSQVVSILAGLNGKMDYMAELSEKLDHLQIVLDSGVLVGGIANKMNRRLGVIASREERRN